jgi:hypothetical protein
MKSTIDPPFKVNTNLGLFACLGTLR